jgi:CobQ-like glutamine amidotransferase family enzyme
VTTIRIVRFAEKLFNTHGDVENARVLAHRATLWGATAETVSWDGGKWSGPSPQIVVIGSAMEFQWARAFETVKRAWEAIAQWQSSGAVVLAVGTGAEMLGESVERSGELTPGVGAHSGEARLLPEHQSVFVEVHHQRGPAIGFLNRDRSMIFPENVERGTVVSPGMAAGDEDLLITREIVVTALRGPVLSLNPWLADAILQQAGINTRGPKPPRLSALDGHAQLVQERIRHGW